MPSREKSCNCFNNKVVRLLISILICQSAGIIGSVFTFSAIPTWYETINKPDLSPPNWVFGPVWTTLYLLMGIALYLIWNRYKQNKQAATKAMSIFAVQLILNAIWSVLFFGMQNPLFAFIEIVFLWAAIIASIYYFYKIYKPAAYLLIPYILWVTFAAYLNFNFILLN